MITEMQKKMGGWIVELVAPALIMIMTGSLTFFLMQVVYHGDYPGRVGWVLGLFIFASVLTSRISIMEGFEKAIFYGLLLGAATLFVLTTLTNLSLLLGIMFIGIIWWFNSKLTWDCTVIDNTRDSTDRGLLTRFGFGKRKAKSEHDETDEDEADSGEEIQGTSSTEQRKATSWTSRFVGKKKVPNTPGVWVLILSLAAFPIFGIGQSFIGDEVRRQGAFFYFCTYLAAGLGLLVTTAMMGLQRYLQRRNATMPNAVAISWVGFGAMMILAILVAAWILPRPYSEYSVAENPFKYERSSNWGSSRNSFGQEGKDDGRGGGKTDSSKQPNGSGSGKGNEKNQSGKSQSGKSQSGKSQSGKSQSGKSQSGKSQSGKSQSGKSQSGKSQSGKSQSGKSQSGKSQSGKSSTGGNRQKETGSTKSSDGQKSNPENSQSGSSKSGKQNSESKENSQSKSNTQSGKRNAESQKNGSQNNEQSGKRNSESQNSNGARSGNRNSNSNEPKRSDDSERNEQQERQKNQNGGSSSSSQSRGKSGQKSNSNTSSSSQNRSNSSRSFQMPSVRGWLWILQWIFVIVILIAAVYFGWKYRHEIWQKFLDFLKELKEFWANLWSRKNAAEKETVEQASPLAQNSRKKSFADFPNPYLTGQAQGWTVETLVKYSFEALEAWGRERGVSRDEDQTPHEYALALVDLEKSIARSAKKLADFYCAVAFAKDRLDAEMVNNELKQLWTRMSGQPLPPGLQPA